MSIRMPMAWDSVQLDLGKCPEGFCGLQGKYAYIKADKAIFTRALIIKETRETLTVRYVEKTDHKTGDPVTRTESIKRSDIVSFRVYKN